MSENKAVTGGLTVSASDEYMQEAINEAYQGICAGDGGPFGTVIVKDGEIVGRGHNGVLRDHDATCHGEVAAIRDAGRRLGTHDLSGCVLYTTGEPCPMCLCATMWANISQVYYGCTIADNERIGFRDRKFEKMFRGREQLGGYLKMLDRAACLELFDVYAGMDRTIY